MTPIKLKIDYTFKDNNLFRQAMSHPSVVKNFKGEHNEKLEFLGDKILGIVIAELLYNTYPEANEGELSIMHAKLVGTNQLALIAKNIGINAALLVDIGEEKSGGRENERNLENAMEALIAAIYLDSDYLQVRQIMHDLWHPFLDKDSLLEKDVKTKLQEWAQQHKLPLPNYILLAQTGKSHEPIFTVQVNIENFAAAKGMGTSRKKADHAAATNLLYALLI